MRRSGVLLSSDSSEHVDEHVTDAPALLFGVFDPRKRREELVRRVGDHEADPHVLAERALDVLPLVLSKEPVVDMDAREPVPDRPVHEGSGNGRIDAAGQPTDSGSVAHRGSDPFHGLVYECTRSPCGAAPTDPEQEIRNDLFASDRMGHLGMKLNPENGALRMPKRRYRQSLGRGQGTVALRRLIDVIGVGAPHLRGLIRQKSMEQVAGLSHVQFGTPVLPASDSNLTALELRDHLHPVTDPQDRNTQMEKLRVRGRDTLVVDRGRAT